MISIIICSRTKAIGHSLFENIKNTIGCDYELVVIDNSENKHTIFEAYNLGIEKSSGALLCFLHDDIFIHTNGWGNVVNRIFDENQKAGLLGVAGAKIKTRMPSGWWNCPNELKEINILQHMTENAVEKWAYGFKAGNLSEVAAIDGVFMAMRKSGGFLFNAKLKGFHNYDLNISIACKMKGFRILATNEILIEHFSNGNINASWYESTLELHRIYRKSLPLAASDFHNPGILKETEFANGRRIAGQLISSGYRTAAFIIWIRLLLIRPVSGFHWQFLKKMIRSAYKKS